MCNERTFALRAARHNSSVSSDRHRIVPRYKYTLKVVVSSSGNGFRLLIVFVKTLISGQGAQTTGKAALGHLAGSDIGM